MPSALLTPKCNIKLGLCIHGIMDHGYEDHAQLLLFTMWVNDDQEEWRQADIYPRNMDNKYKDQICISIAAYLLI